MAGRPPTNAMVTAMTTLGHNANSFTADLSGAGAEPFQKFIVQGIKSAMGLTEFCTE